MHPAFGWVGGVALAHAAAGLYIASVAFSPTAQKSREHFLDHASEVIEKMREVGLSPSKKKLKALHKDILLLRKNIGVGWVERDEIVAGVRVCAFVISAHTKSTGHGLLKVGDNAGKAIVDAIFRPIPLREFWEGNRPQQG